MHFKDQLNGRREMLMIVDEDGRYLGEKEKWDCHRDGGCLHSAFLVMMIHFKTGLMLARRSEQKLLWPRFWDGTVAGHFHRGESREESMRRRIFKELGVSCGRFDFLFELRYLAAFENVGVENEICSVYRTGDFPAGEIAANPEEVLEYRFSDIPALGGEVEARPSRFTPWFLPAFEKILKMT